MRHFPVCSISITLALLLTACEQGTPEATQATDQSTLTGNTAGDQQRITIINPGIPGKVVERIPLLPRLDTLEGKTLYMVDVQWGGPDAAYSVFEEMQAWFATHMPTVKTVLRRTKGNIFSDDPELWQEIADRGDAAIVGISG
jgi:hypothetical protein